MRDPVTKLAIVDGASVEPEICKAFADIFMVPDKLAVVHYITKIEKRSARFGMLNKGILIVSDLCLYFCKEDGTRKRCIRIRDVAAVYQCTDMYIALNLPNPEYAVAFKLANASEAEYLFNILRVVQEVCYGRTLEVTPFGGPLKNLGLSFDRPDNYVPQSVPFTFLSATDAADGALDELLRPPAPPHPNRQSDHSAAAAPNLSPEAALILRHPLLDPHTITSSALTPRSGQQQPRPDASGADARRAGGAGGAVDTQQYQQQDVAEQLRRLATLHRSLEQEREAIDDDRRRGRAAHDVRNASASASPVASSSAAGGAGLSTGGRGLGAGDAPAASADLTSSSATPAEQGASTMYLPSPIHRESHTPAGGVAGPRWALPDRTPPPAARQHPPAPSGEPSARDAPAEDSRLEAERRRRAELEARVAQLTAELEDERVRADKAAVAQRVEAARGAHREGPHVASSLLLDFEPALTPSDGGNAAAAAVGTRPAAPAAGSKGAIATAGFSAPGASVASASAGSRSTPPPPAPPAMHRHGETTVVEFEQAIERRPLKDRLVLRQFEIDKKRAEIRAAFDRVDGYDPLAVAVLQEDLIALVRKLENDVAEVDSQAASRSATPRVTTQEAPTQTQTHHQADTPEAPAVRVGNAAAPSAPPRAGGPAAAALQYAYAYADPPHGAAPPAWEWTPERVEEYWRWVASYYAAGGAPAMAVGGHAPPRAEDQAKRRTVSPPAGARASAGKGALGRTTSPAAATVGGTGRRGPHGYTAPTQAFLRRHV